jgi:hypothetical protein
MKKTCPKKNKDCKPQIKIPAGSHYICAGLNSKPKMYHKDIIKLCLCGKYVKDFAIEMTPQEALLIIKVLIAAITPK